MQANCYSTLADRRPGTTTATWTSSKTKPKGGVRMHGYWTIAGIIVLVLLLLLSGCAAHFTIHPGALNQTDSAAYDALLIAETAISEARQDLQTGALPDSTKAALNSLI